MHNFIVLMFVIGALLPAQGMLFIPMDNGQTEHLKAYGVVYRALKSGVKAYWLLNYRGGAFAVEPAQAIVIDARKEGVEIAELDDGAWAGILTVIEQNNMDKVTLEKAPDVAVYTPPGKLPWDDAVTMALTYARIPYDKVYDREVVTGGLQKYEWLHLHHEDFTGQYSKFYRSFGQAPWYLRQKSDLETLSQSLGFAKVSDCKKAVAVAIRNYVEKGGFLFAMCSAANTLDIALATVGVDICDEVFDGDGIDPAYTQKMSYAHCFAFENFTVFPGPDVSYFDNIDYNLVNTPTRREAHDFVLFPYSARLDPVPCMLNQNHSQTITGFFGLTTSFNKNVIKKSVVVLGSTPGVGCVQYLHGVRGNGMFAFLGGHDPEDYSHAVGDEPTKLELHPHSPGYRLILNNVLFPAAEKKEKKT